MEVAIIERSHFGQLQNSRDQLPVKIFKMYFYFIKDFLR
jgi:hypothetical protein